MKDNERLVDGAGNKWKERDLEVIFAPASEMESHVTALRIRGVVHREKDPRTLERYNGS